MFQEGQYVMYERTGVCLVSGILPASQVPGAQKKAAYYQLTPTFGQGTIYIPGRYRSFYASDSHPSAGTCIDSEDPHRPHCRL